MHAEHKKEVVVLIMAYRSELSEFEKISLRQCLKVLKDHPIAIVKPASSTVESWDLEGVSVTQENFPDKYFKSVGSYSRLLLSVDFYKRFSNYKYMLIHQLDAFVFKDELSQWCKRDFDYIGAPWFENFSPDNDKAEFIRGGNGGFSLRKISSHQRVLRSFSYISRPVENWKFRMANRQSGRSIFAEFSGLLLDMVVRNNTFWMLNSFKGFEDQFWCLVAARNFEWFTLPDPQEELKFAFEMQPARMYRLNNFELPFGCHAWWKYDLQFWKPWFEKQGYTINDKTISGN